MLRDPPQGRGFGVSVRLKTISLCQLRMIRGTVFQLGRGWLGDRGWEASIDKRVGQAGDKMSWPKQTSEIWTHGSRRGSYALSVINS